MQSDNLARARQLTTMICVLLNLYM